MNKIRLIEYVFITVAFIISAFIYLNLGNYSTESQLVGNTFDYRNIIVSSLDFKITWLNNGTLNNRNFTIIDRNYKILYRGTTNIYPVHVDLKEICNIDDYYYVNMTMTAHFTEGGTETRYMYYLFSFQRNSGNNLSINADVSPATWERIPQLR